MKDSRGGFYNFVHYVNNKFLPVLLVHRMIPEHEKKKEMVKAHWRIAEGILSVSSKQLHVKYRIENVTK